MRTTQLPSFRVGDVLRRRDGICEDTELMGYLYQPLDQELFPAFVRRMAEVLELYDERPVQDSCMYLLGAAVTDVEFRRLAWRLSGNMQRLRNGKAVLPWQGFSKQLWLPLQIIGHELCRFRDGRPAANMQFRILAGAACPETATAKWSNTFGGVVARELGFPPSFKTKGVPDRLFRDFRQFMDMRLLGLFTPDDGLYVSQIEVTSSIKQWNRKVIERRARTKFKCPLSLPVSFACWQCPAGKDKCPAAVHLKSYIKEHCSQCNKKQWKESEVSELCVECSSKQLLGIGPQSKEKT